MSPMASHITSLTIVYSIVYSITDRRKHQSSASLAFVRGIHWWPVNSPYKGPVTRKMFPFDNVIMIWWPFAIYVLLMITSWYGNAFLITGPLWRASIESPHKRTIMWNFSHTFVIDLNKLSTNQLSSGNSLWCKDNGISIHRTELSTTRCGESQSFIRLRWNLYRYTVRCHYNAVNLLQNSHNRHPIARPWGRGMGCLLWIWSLICVMLLSS